MLKVVHINHSDFGGAAIAAVRLHKGMLASGLQSKILTYVKTRNDFPEHYLLNEITCSSYPALTKLKLLLKRGLRKLKLIKDYEKTHLANRPSGFELFTFPFPDFDISNHPQIKEADIVHLHWVARDFIDYHLFFTNKNKKIVWTFHDMNPFTGGCHHADDCIGFQNNCFPCPQLKNTIDEKMANKVLSIKTEALQSYPTNNLVVVTPSNWLKLLAAKSIVFKNFKVKNIPNCVDSTIFKPSAKKETRDLLNLPVNVKIILFTSLDINNPRKGMSQLTEAIKKIKLKDEIVICTLGHNRNNDFPNSISLGYIKDEQQLATIYSAADVFVLPSLAENYPNSICESLLCGTPVVAYRTGGNPEQITEQNGIMVPIGSITELAQAIEKVLNRPEMYNSEKIHQAAKNLFSNDVVIPEYEKIYLQLINQVN